MVRVPQHVRERVAHFGRRTQHVRVEAVRKHLPPPLPPAVQRLRNAHAHALHAAREALVIIRLAHDVDVVAHRGVVHETEAVVLRAGDEDLAQHVVRVSAAQRR
jgi:hypothetical protein